MISALINDMRFWFFSACNSAETLCEVVQAIRSIPEHKRIVIGVRNSDSARDILVSNTMALVECDDPSRFDYPIAASIIALADSGRDDDAIFVSSKASCDPSLEIASGIADSFLLQKALE